MRQRRSLAVVPCMVTIAMLFAIAAPAVAQTEPTSTETEPPVGAPDVDVEWHTIQHPDGTSQLVAVARPPKGKRKGKGPFPAVIELHGGSGLGPAMVEHAASLAKAGFVVVLGCYAPDQGWSGPPWCATTPFVPNALEALDEFTSELPGVRKRHIGVLGLSSGAGPTFNYPWGPSVRALAVDSGIGNGPTGEFVTDAAAPVLLLYGSSDDNIPRDVAEDFIATLRENDVPTDAKIFEGAEHVVTIPGAANDVSKQANERLVKFLRKQLDD